MVTGVVAVTALSLAAVSLVLCWRQLRINRSLTEQIEDLHLHVNTNRADAAPAGRSFASRLTSVEQEQTAEVDVKSLPHAEKYRYAAALVQQGYTTAGIADALQMAPAEVEQIMQLAKIKGSGSG